MTTILIDRKELAMACDVQATTGNRKFQYGSKIESYDGFLIAGCGDVEQCQDFEKWFVDKKKARRRWSNMEAVVLYRDGGLFFYEGRSTPIPVVSRYFGIGSGSAYGLGALLHGASLREAIRIASMCDVLTGLGVQCRSLK